MNCDNFLLVNNTFGYELGDQLLCQVADRIRALQVAESVLARLGADEFCLLINQPPTPESLQILAAAIHECLAASFEIKPYTIYLSFSIGIVPVDESYCLGNPEDVLRDAETAMKLSQKNCLGSYQVFNPQMHQATRERLMLEMELRQALNQDELFTYYQPIVNLRTLKIVGFEALIRWDHPQRGMIRPDLFIPCTEETGLIIPLGIKILRQACEQLQRWTQDGFNHLEMSVNISPAQFAYPRILEQIDTVLADTGLSPHQLKLEITEGVIFDHPQTGIELIRALRQRNIRICIDDFGTGYSSLSYLTQFPANTLKIDRAFITKMKSSHRDEAVVSVTDTSSKKACMARNAEMR